MAKEKKEVPDEQEQPPVPKKKSNMKLVLIGIISLAVVVSATAAGIYFFSQRGSNKTSTEKAVISAVWPMDAFVINIADTNGERYLKIVIQLEVSNPDVISQLEQLKPRLRDSIIDLLTPLTFKELMDLPGKQRLREDIAGRINNILTEGKVIKVYFTDFVVQ